MESFESNRSEPGRPEKLESYKSYMFCRCWCCQFLILIAILGIKLYFLGFYLSDGSGVRVDDIGGQQLDTIDGLIMVANDYVQRAIDPTFLTLNRNFHIHLNKMDFLMNQPGVAFKGNDVEANPNPVLLPRGYKHVSDRYLRERLQTTIERSF